MGAKLDHHDHWEKIIVAPWCCFTNQTGEKIVRWRVAQKHETKHFEIFLFRAMSKFHQGRWYGQAAWSWKFRSGTKLKTHTPWIIDGSPRTIIPYYDDKNPEFVFDEGGPDCDWNFESTPYPCLPEFIENLIVEKVNTSTSSLNLLVDLLCL